MPIYGEKLTVRCTAMKVSPLIAWAVVAYSLAIVIAVLTLLPSTWWRWSWM